MDALAQFPYLNNLDTATREQLMERLHSRSFKAGEIIYAQGESPSGLYFIVTGNVFLYRQSGDKMQVLAMVQPGDCFGGESIVNQKPNPYNARAIIQTQAFYLSSEHLVYCIQAYPDFLSVFLTLVTQRLRQLTTLVHDLAFRDVASRLATVLILFAETHGVVGDDGVVHIPQLVSQHDLAAMVGTAREVVYRTLKCFEGEGILRKDLKEFLIYDMPALREIAQAEAK